MWPRHTGDFSFYRAYVGPDGKPAEPSPDNVPYQPKHWLKVGTDGVEDGDFVMVAGYPGRTNRYRLATEVENAIEWYYPRRIKPHQEMLDIIDRETEGRLRRRSSTPRMVAGLNNALKNYQGMLDGFAKTDVGGAQAGAGGRADGVDRGRPRAGGTLRLRDERARRDCSTSSAPTANGTRR